MTTVEEEINYWPVNIGMPEEERIQTVEQLVAQLGLTDKLKKHPFELTRLERKMVCIAGVLAMKPKVIVFDEPTTGQDAVQTRVIMDLFQEFSAQGHTLVVVSHDMSLIAEYCTHVLVMNKGQILADGKPEDVFADREVLSSASLAPPQITQIAHSLEIARPILSVADALQYLSELKS
jgi:energy-coupling factor transport system ATP-binding protein